MSTNLTALTYTQNLEAMGLMERWTSFPKIQLWHQVGNSLLKGWGSALHDAGYAWNQKPLQSVVSPTDRTQGTRNQARGEEGVALALAFSHLTSHLQESHVRSRQFRALWFGDLTARQGVRPPHLEDEGHLALPRPLVPLQQQAKAWGQSTGWQD